MHDSLIQCHGNSMEKKKFNNMLENDILRNSSQKYLDVLRVAFSKVWVSKKTPSRPAVNQPPCEHNHSL